MYAAELQPRAKPGYVHSLGCDPVKFSQELGRANLTLAFTQNQCLLASKPTSELQSVIPPLADLLGFAHSSFPWGRVFAPLSCLGGGLKQNKSEEL